MKKIRIKHTDLEVSNLVMGCMRIGELSEKELEELTETYLSEGVNFLIMQTFTGAAPVRLRLESF